MSNGGWIPWTSIISHSSSFFRVSA